jgi:archaellum component FlaG (FlaF/FlaG flagellin family)
MKKLMLFVTALVIAGGTGAYAQGAHHAGDNVQLASYHRAHHHYHGYGRMDDPTAEGRTSG